MQYSTLGASQVKVSRVIFGAMGFGKRSDQECIRSLHAAFAAGITIVDTAPLYGFGESERWVGQAIADRRDSVQLLTKVGLSWDDQHGEVLFQFPDDSGRMRAVRRDSRPHKIRVEVEASLKRLGTEVIDLIQVHHLDLHTPIADTLGELNRLRQEGKVRAIGVSNYPVRSLDQSLAVLGADFVSNQCEFNLLSRGVQRDVLPWCRDHQVAVLVYSPLAQGLLAGRSLSGSPPPADWRNGGLMFRPGNLRRIDGALRQVAVPIAARHKVGLSEVALAWLLAQSGVTAVIAGASSETQAASNARAAGLALDAAELSLLDQTFSQVRISDGPLEVGTRLLRRIARCVRSALRA
jgi:aryl-alcohol dehydrogenase-like predicted oxidoreductase